MEVPRVEFEKLIDRKTGEPSDSIRRRVETARAIQVKRFSQDVSSPGKLITCNADMRPAEVRKYCVLDQAGTTLIKAAMNQLQLSARAYHRILKLSRTIADLAGSETIQTTHLAEALQYRPKNLLA